MAAAAVTAAHPATRQFAASRRLLAADATSAADMRALCNQAAAALRLLFQLLVAQGDASESPASASAATGTKLTEFIAKSSLVPTVLAAMKLQSSSMECYMAYHAADCIKALAGTQSLAKRFVSVGACDELVAALHLCAELHTVSEQPHSTPEMQLLRSAVCAMHALLLNTAESDHAIIEASGAVAALVAVLQAFSLLAAGTA